MSKGSVQTGGKLRFAKENKKKYKKHFLNQASSTDSPLEKDKKQKSCLFPSSENPVKHRPKRKPQRRQRRNPKRRRSDFLRTVDGDGHKVKLLEEWSDAVTHNAIQPKVTKQE